MKDLNINIGGPSEQARQNISFQIHQGDRPASIDAERIALLVRELNTALQTTALPANDRRRIARHLGTIEDEAQSEPPSLDEVHRALDSVGRIVQSAGSLGTTVATTLRSLAACVGLTWAW